MSKPENLFTKIFLDSGDPQETKLALQTLGWLDGQTTNPSLVAKNPEVQARIASGKKFTRQDLLYFYKEIIQEISRLIPSGSVSIEVYADRDSSWQDLLTQAEEMYTWIDNAHIKFPTIPAGLQAAHKFIQQKGRVNMTLCFNQKQAVAVHGITQGCQKGDVFYSSFVGRFFDNGVNGVKVLENVIRTYKDGNNPVEVLACSFRSFEQFLACLQLKANIITAPLRYIQEWKENGLIIPDESFIFDAGDAQSPAFEEIDLNQDWQEIDIENTLTMQGLDKFAQDWNNLLD